MNRFLLFTIIIISLSACTKEVYDIDTPTAPSDKIFNYDESAALGRLMVRMVDTQGDIAVDGINLDVEPLFPNTTGSDKLSRWMLVQFNETLDLKSVAEKIAALETVERVEYDIKLKLVKSESVPTPTSRPEPTRSQSMPFNDPELPYQWHYYNDGSLSSLADEPNTCLAGADINLFNAWKYTTGDRRVIVAVMDDGVNVNHKDLKANIWVNEAELNGQLGIDDDMNGYVDDINGYNFAQRNGKITAGDHGTHIAGTISAVNNNNYSGCGIAGGTGNDDGVRIMPIQISSTSSYTYSYNIAQGYAYAANNGAVLICSSWNYGAGAFASDEHFELTDSAIKDAIDYFQTEARLDGVMEGGVVIFAAGDETYPAACYPGAYHEYISVTAMSPDFTAAPYTNYGPGCNVVAPGGDNMYTVFGISSTSKRDDRGDGYEYQHGTAMAASHVTGCAALALSYALKQGYTLSPDYLRTLIQTSVHDINPYQTGSRWIYDYDRGEYSTMELDLFANKLGSGYIDAHLLLMQLDSTPCLYFKSGVAASLSLDEYFGSGSKSLTYQGCEVTDSVRSDLGIEGEPCIEDGKLSIKCNKPGLGRIKVSAIIGGNEVGGGDNMGGMVVEREFELVVRGSVASNGGWL